LQVLNEVFMRRRDFLCLAAAAAAKMPAAKGSAKISRITITPIEGRFHKKVAMNAYDQAPKGETYATHLLRVFTAEGVSGTGTLDYSSPDKAMLESLRNLIGADPLELYEIRQGRILTVRNPALAKYRFLDSVLFDLVGQILNVPCHELIGPSAREQVEVYDGTLYFSDVMIPEKGVGAVVAEAEEAVRSGYRGLKLKVGRCDKWMPGVAGVLRDIEVVNAVRRAVGPEVKIMADANNGYRGRLQLAWRFLSETQKSNLFWIEEIFPEDPELYARLREKLQQAGMKTLIADGENMRSADELRPYLKPRTIDVTQLDIRRAGFLGNREAAELAAENEGFCVPHNWGSQIGGLMNLHFAKAVAAAITAEDDRSRCDAIIADGYEFRNGFYTLPKTPGLSLRVNEAVYQTKYKFREIAV
jgi:D-galactarolactone cycloisomerase